jgi:periplasmic protein TonB
MIAKKNSGLDLESKRSAFFTLGMLVTGSLTLAAFTYSDPMLRADKGELVAVEQLDIDYQEDIKKPEEKMDVPVKIDIPNNSSQQSTVDASAVVSEVISLTTNTTTNITSTVNANTGGLLIGPDLTRGAGPVKVEAEKIEDFVDIEATFIGGAVEMKKFILSTVEYPEMCIEAKVEGTVHVTFVVEKDGSVTNVEIERGVHKDLDREAKRVVHEFPNWIPGEIAAKKVRTRVRIPIVFTLN